MPVEDLPNELVDHIFDYAPLGLSDVVRASHVSARWRRIAHAHPTFCRYIDFVYDANMPHNAELCSRLRTQVGYSQRQLHMNVRYTGDDDSVLETIVSVLKENMHRVLSLGLTLSVRHRHRILVALDVPAPQLTWLRVQAYEPVSIGRQTVILPPVLYGAGGKLETLTLYNVDFPIDPGDTLQFIKDLTLHNYRPTLRREVETAISACPQLRRLDFSLNSTHGAARYMDSLVRDVMHIPAVARLRDVGLHSPMYIENSYDHIIPHLTGPLHLQLSDSKLEPKPSGYNIVLVEQSTGRTRRLGYPSFSVLSMAADRFAQLDLAARIVQLSVWMRLLGVPASLFPTLPRLEVFVIHLHAEYTIDEVYRPPVRSCAINVDDDTSLLPNMPSCPSLRKIAIHGRGQHCTAGWLSKFVATSLKFGTTSGPGAPLELELGGVSLVGDPRVLHSYFSDIRPS
ncbi:hypothetical protein AURDEDRAFT_185598 [Auricularia subglabra TFB-10046 SS5]|nr:hypothetical protein AURDEDRAFT_185598 [Auricularia subglabra TFB-10046 SS5]